VAIVRGAKIRNRAARPKPSSMRTFVFLHFILHPYEYCMAKLISALYKKILGATNVHRKVCTPLIDESNIAYY